MLQNSIPQRYKQANDILQALSRKSVSVAKSCDFAVANIDKIKVQVDFNQLRNLLKKRKWQQADTETWNIMCISLSKPIRTHLFKSDIENLPDDSLRIIDLLWAKYSNGRFGFNVQKEIYDSVDADYFKFCETVGWSTYNSSDSGNLDYYYNLKAPMGHLPTRTWMGGSQWWKHADTFAAKLDKILWGVGNSN